MSRKTAKKSAATQEVNKPIEPTSMVYVTAVGPEALALCTLLSTRWNKQATNRNDEGFTQSGPEDMLGEALSIGLHLLALKDLGDPDAWNDQAAVFGGASNAAMSLQDRFRQMAGTTYAESNRSPNAEFVERGQEAIMLASRLDAEGRGTIIAHLETELRDHLVRMAREKIWSGDEVSPR